MNCPNRRVCWWYVFEFFRCRRSQINLFFFFLIISLFQATAEANNLAAVAGAKDVYAQLMESVCGGAKPYLGAGHLEAEHLRIKDKAIFQVCTSFRQHSISIE